MSRSFDRRWLDLGLGLVVLVFILVPGALPRLPDQVTPQVQGYVDAIDGLTPGAVVLLACDYDPASKPEMEPMHRATLHHLFARGVRVVTVTTWEAGPGLAPAAFAHVVPAAASHRGAPLVEGVDYVDLGFKAGREVVISSMGRSLFDTFPNVVVDGVVQSSRDVPLLRGLDDLSRFDLLISIGAGVPGARDWLRTAQALQGVPLIAGVTSPMAPDLFPFHQSGQLRGFLPGAVGADLYEGAVAERGMIAARSRLHENMAIQSVVQMGLIALVLIGGVWRLLDRRRRDAG